MIKKYIPQGIKDVIIALRDKGQILVIWLFSRSRFLSSFYYCFFSRTFAREHQSVLLGRLSYRKNKGMKDNSNVLLRRNIHRIEKGLIMQPQKPIFALDYIGETIEQFDLIINSETYDKNELKWVEDVLIKYYKTINTELLPIKLQQYFEINITKKDKGDQKKHIPYAFSDRINSKVTADQFKTLCIQRRSVRWFENKEVPNSLLEKAVEIASLAPSACNRQPFKFYIANKKPLSQQLINIPMGTKGFADNVPCTIVVSGDLSYYPTERDRHLIYIDSALAGMQLMLALETLGLSSCPINWPDLEDKEIKISNLLNLPQTIRPTMLIAVGYGAPEGKIPYSQKKPANQLINYI